MKHWLTILLREMRSILSDEGVLMFVVVVPLFYPLLYSWVYNNELVREVPVVVVDNSHSALSRQFVNAFDASPDVKVVAHAANMEVARDMIGRQEAYGIVCLPEDFDRSLGRMEQATVLVYTDMNIMLAYKAIYQTCTIVAMDMGNDLKRSLSGAYTSRDEELAVAPVEVRDVPMFNPSQGYGSFILPAVLVLVVQQTMLLGIGLIVGTRIDRRRLANDIMLSPQHSLMRALCFIIIYIVLSMYLLVAVPSFFSFLQLVSPRILMLFITPYLLACAFFATVFSYFVREREKVMILVVFTSVLFLMLSGVSWPGTNIPDVWKWVSYIFPSTFGIQGYVKLNSMGASFRDVMPEYTALWVQTTIYFLIAAVFGQLRSNKENKLRK